MHHGSFSKQFEQIATAANAVSDKSFLKLEVSPLFHEFTFLSVVRGSIDDKNI